MEQKRQRHQKKAELGKRRSAASQNRMRIISQLGADDNQLKRRSKKQKEDTFGMNDEDWNVYRDIVSYVIRKYNVHAMKLQYCDIQYKNLHAITCIYHSLDVQSHIKMRLSNTTDRKKCHVHCT